ncbi:phage tail-collar fiber domain-containing protein [Acinetobacter baumannii]|uniref:phage tail-collar fiber domain-containing protein n=1 Tax=Acinetobacter baumannii TaxID=470 RepID=UPI003F19D0CB
MSSPYYNVTTNAGDAAIANAIATNTKLNITHVAFGDGNGSSPTPDKTRTSLVKEVYRQGVNKYEKHPTINNFVIVEAILPPIVGSFYIREIGLIIDGKTLISHGAVAPVYKEANSVREYQLRFTINIQDAQIVNVTLDDTLIYATQGWVNDNYVPRKEIIDNLTTNDPAKPLSAKQGKYLQDNKLDKNANAVGLQIKDNRTLKPSQLSQSIQAFFGTLNSDGSSFFCDYLTLNGWNDYSGGRKNALVFNKTAQTLHHYQADYDSETWTLKKQIAYTDSDISGNAASATKLKNARLINGVTFDGSNDIRLPPVAFYIPAGADLDNYQSIGFYYQDTDLNASQIANVPQANAFGLRVETHAGVSQWFMPYNGGGIMYYRHFYVGKWTPWKKIDPSNIDGNAATASKLQNVRRINTVAFDGTSDITIYDDTKFKADGSTSTVYDVAWNAKSGVYTIQESGGTSTVMHFLGSGSAPAVQILAKYANGGLWYRSARDAKGFEVEFEKILTEKGGTVKGALATNSISNTGDIYTTGTFVAGNTAGEARLQLAGTNRYFYLNSGSWGVWTENGSEPLSKLCGGTGRADGAAEKLVTPRQVSFSGAASGSFTYDGSANSSCILTLANSGVVAGTYSSTIQIPSITVNDKGLITGISQQTIRSASVTQAGVVQLVDDLVTDDNAKALTAKQGRALQLLKLDKNANAVGLQMGDDRTLLPTELSPLSVQTFFGTYNSDGTSAFCDFITLNGWIDASGGRKNALVFNKISTGLYHFQADYNSQNWTIKKELAYTDSNISGNAASATRLQNGRNINSVYFDGTQDLNIEAPLCWNGTIATFDQLNLALKDGKFTVTELNIAGLYGYGFLVVIRSGGTCHQIYYPHAAQGVNNGTMAMRQSWNVNGNTATWSEWRVVGTQDDSKLPLVGGTVTGNLRVNGIIFSNKVYGDSYLWFTSENEQKGRRVLTGGVLASDTYSEASLVPNLGMYAKGAIHTGTGVYADKYYGYNGTAQFIGNLDGKLLNPRLINGVAFDASNNINVPPVSFYIPAGADLNNYKSTGFFYQDTDAATAQIANVPQANAFALRVEASAGCDQWFIPYNGGGVMYYRHFYNGNWSSWKKIDPSNIDGNAATATKLQNARRINSVAFDGTSDITVYDDTKFKADGTTSTVYEVAWNAKSGVYTIQEDGGTSTVMHFLGSGSAPAIQILAKYANGGLWYRSARDARGFEVEFEKILTEKGGTVKGGLVTNGISNTGSINNTGDIATKGVIVAGGSLGEARLQLEGSTRYFYLNGDSWGVWSANGSQPLSKTCGGTGRTDGAAEKLVTARQISLTGAVSGSALFDGSGNINISTILNNFGSLKAENGYKYLGDGLILQWGTMDYTSYPGETKVDITFPITFPNNVLNINSTRKMIQHSASGDGGVLLVSQSNSGASFSLNVFNSNSIGDLRGFTWLAIGF